MNKEDPQVRFLTLKLRMASSRHTSALLVSEHEPDGAPAKATRSHLSRPISTISFGRKSTDVRVASLSIRGTAHCPIPIHHFPSIYTLVLPQPSIPRKTCRLCSAS